MQMNELVALKSARFINGHIIFLGIWVTAVHRFGNCSMYIDK